MENINILFLLLIIISGCATWPAGEDPKGKKLKSQANEVIVAINSYKNDNNKLPENLEKLIPNYLTKLPEQLNLEYSKSTEGILLNYTPTWPQPGRTSCSLNLNQTTWKCIGYL